MTDPTNFRRERIEKLLHELRYEVERGMMERDLDEEMGFRFYVPISQKIPDGVVFCEFRTRPVPRHVMDPRDLQPRLKLVKSDTPS
ncbi:hypothetical protein [Bradyrhizobium sp. JR18.2]|uniref:hypothetical protein n=1 Tax=Bradyrhizobium sp. JR18.2 TaxID=3156369 RepID=UPI00339AA4D1